ncbi:MAG TPA: hypothetical protein VK045_06650 [Ornithinicoccus sp.]|nr:hypothetical protein [Ornithinicoccus sp.]
MPQHPLGGPPEGSRRSPRGGVPWRRQVAIELALPTGGLVHRADLRRLGISRHDVRHEVDGGRWTRTGRHTVLIASPVPDLVHPSSPRWPTPRPATWPAVAAWAVWESGSGAVLDGTSALRLAGLTHFDDDSVHVAVPRGSRAIRLPGVRLRRPRLVSPAPGAGLRRTTTEAAVINAAQWAVSDRQAALIIAMAVQQRITSGRRLLHEWERRGRVRRRQLIDVVLRDVAGGAQALGELDFARLCRQHGLPTPSRQVVCNGPRGRIYLDVWWESLGVGAEIDGAQHGWGLNRVDDALRDNELMLADGLTLRIPVLGLRVAPAQFMSQVRRMVEIGQRRRLAG